MRGRNFSAQLVHALLRQGANWRRVSLALKRIGEIPPAEKKAYGQEVNRITATLTEAYESALAQEKERQLVRDLSRRRLSTSRFLVGRLPTDAYILPRGVMRVTFCSDFCRPRVFRFIESREVEDDLTNFELLNHASASPSSRHVGHVSHDRARRVACARILRQARFTSCASSHPRPIRVILPGNVLSL